VCVWPHAALALLIGHCNNIRRPHAKEAAAVASSSLPPPSQFDNKFDTKPGGGTTIQSLREEFGVKGLAKNSEQTRSLVQDKGTSPLVVKQARASSVMHPKVFKGTHRNEIK
jgi:hypothetical protein